MRSGSMTPRVNPVEIPIGIGGHDRQRVVFQGRDRRSIDRIGGMDLPGMKSAVTPGVTPTR